MTVGEDRNKDRFTIC